MVTLTRADKQQIFKYVFRSVLNLDDSDVLYQIFSSNQMTTLEDMFSIKDDRFSALKYIDTYTKLPVTTLEPLLLRLRILKAWHYYLLKIYDWDQVNWEDKTKVNLESYDEFRITEYNPETPANPNLSESTSKSVMTKSTSSLPFGSKSLVSEFRKGIKREKSAYLILKDERN